MGFGDSLLSSVVQAAERANPPAPGDFIGEDGLLYCGKCQTRKQCRVNLLGATHVFPLMCQCSKDAADRERAERDRRDIAYRLEWGGVSPNCTFDGSENQKPFQICRRWAEHWPEVREKNAGLLLWGGVGTGKTHAAHCIANALIHRKPHESAYMVTISAALNGKFDKSEILSKIRGAGIVCFDDLGVERSNEYGMENVFTLIDERYRVKRPMIVTTNLSLKELETAKDTGKRRIYDRVLEVCYPVFFDGPSRRASISSAKRSAMRELLEGG